MKLSLAWIFDHLKAELKDIDVQYLVSKLSSTTSEIEGCRHVKVDTDLFTLAKVEKISPESIELLSTEWNKKIVLPLRKDVVVGQIYLVKKDNKIFSWSSLSDFGSEKEGLLTSLFCDEAVLKGAWKSDFESEDYILELDNKAITNRPDLWGHRGFAREVAAILQKELLPEERFLASKPIKHYTSLAPVSSTNPFTLEIDPSACAIFCKRIAGIYLPNIEHKDSILKIAIRLARIDSRPIDTIVDFTNYVMFDLGHPMHAFDSKKISGEYISARCAKHGEKLTLLDGQTIELTAADYIIADDKKPLALAGIMGGEFASVSKETDSVFLEAGSFDASVIRKSSTFFKKRTESSARFEKSLDPNQNTQALLRFLKLLEDYSIQFKSSDAISSVGALTQESTITLSQELINNRIGMTVNSDTIERILSKLGFGLRVNRNNNETLYTITIPTYRGTKDIQLKEDIIEEVARFIGYSNIPHVLPSRAMATFDISIIQKIRKIKQYLAYSLNMNEAQTYAFYDEPYLKELKWEPENALQLLNPFSENIKRLVTTLVPNLLKCVQTNKSKEESLRFFELNRVWFLDEKIIERKELAGIFFESKKTIDFYDYKNGINNLFEIFDIEITWQKPTGKLGQWYNLNQTAELKYKDRIIGSAGIASTAFLNNIAQGQAFIFELDADFLLSFSAVTTCFKQLPKYQTVNLDISILINQKITSNELEKLILESDKRITEVQLIDFFEKEEWAGKKSITMRFTLYDENKTLAKEDIDMVWDAVKKNLENIGAAIR